jgi:hypothetical protein
LCAVTSKATCLPSPRLVYVRYVSAVTLGIHSEDLEIRLVGEKQPEESTAVHSFVVYFEQ